VGEIESERFGDTYSYIRGQSVGRNQLRKEIRERLKQLWNTNLLEKKLLSGYTNKIGSVNS